MQGFRRIGTHIAAPAVRKKTAKGYSDRRVANTVEGESTSSQTERSDSFGNSLTGGACHSQMTGTSSGNVRRPTRRKKV